VLSYYKGGVAQSVPLMNTYPESIMTAVVDTDVVLFALSECNTGNELLEYIDSLLEDING